MNIQNRQRAQAVRRDAPVECEQCGRRSPKRSVASNDIRGDVSEPRGTPKRPNPTKLNCTGYHASGERLTPPKNSRNNNSLQAPKTGSSIP